MTVSVSETDYDVFWHAAETGDIITVEQMIARGINVNRRNKEGWTALHMATVRGYHDIRQVLLNAIGRKTMFHHKQPVTWNELLEDNKTVAAA